MMKYIFDSEMKNRGGAGQTKTVSVLTHMAANSHLSLHAINSNERQAKI